MANQKKAPTTHNIRATSDTSAQSGVNVAAPRIRPVELASASPDTTESGQNNNFRKQIEEILKPMYNEAQAYETTNQRQADCNDIMKEIRRIADAMLVVKQLLMTMRPAEQTQDRPFPGNENYGPANNRSKNADQLDGPSRNRNATPPSPLTPPQTPPYIGPILSNEEEEELFDNVSLVIRKQKILEFHQEAAVLDIAVAERLHNNSKDRRKERRGPILKQHQQEVEELRMTKEKERKDTTEVERNRRRVEIAARAQTWESNEQREASYKRPSASQQKRGEDQSRWSSRPRKDRTEGAAKQAGHVGIKYPMGSHGLFSTDHSDRRDNGASVDEPHFESRQSNRITPLTATVGLPDFDSDPDEESDEYPMSSSDDEESIAPVPEIDLKHVRFTPSVLADNPTESSDRTSPFSNTARLRQDFAFDTNMYQFVPSGLGSGKGGARSETTKPLKTARTGLEAKEVKNTEIWYPTENVKGKGKGLPDSPVLSQDKASWVSWTTT
jgi:hypothetical protein